MAVVWQLGASRRVVGAGLIVVGALALVAPSLIGKWSLQFLSLLPLSIGVTNLYSVISAPELRLRPSAYVTSVIAIALAILLYVSASLAVSGVIGILLVLLVADGLLKVAGGIIGAFAAEMRIVSLANGLASLGLAFLGWLLWRTLGVEVAIGAVIGGYTVASGWAMLLSPTRHRAIEPRANEAANQHPDGKLALGTQDLFATIGGRILSSSPTVRQTELHWFLISFLVLFVIHLSRMQSSQTWLGLVSPLVAVVGDMVMSVVLGGGIVLPLRLLWRRLSRPIERSAWRMVSAS